MVFWCMVVESIVKEETNKKYVSLRGFGYSSFEDIYYGKRK